MRMPLSRSPLIYAVVCLLLAGLIFLAGLALGIHGLRLPESLPWHDPILWQVRAPRGTGALVAGALLGMAGALAQGIFRNPLADPYLLGSAAGASLGVALALVAGSGFIVSASWVSWLVLGGLTGAAFAGAMLAVALTLLLAGGAHHPLHLLLCGVVVGVVMAAFSSLLALRHPSIQAALQGFLLGSTAYLGWQAVGFMALVALSSLGLAMALAPVLDALLLGEDTAQSLGLPVQRMRWVLLALLSLATGAAVAQTGLIGFVGLAAPHIVRTSLHCNHRWLLPLSSLTGAILLGVCDLLGRALGQGQEIPPGVLTALLGGAWLLVFLYRHARYGEVP